MKKPVLLLCLILLSCLGYDQTASDIVKTIPAEELEVNRPERFKNQEAKIVVEPFVNKAGRTYPDLAEYYLEFNGERYFIKFSESKITSATLKPLVGQSIYFDGELREGMWDSDDPNVQSRIGHYLAVKRVRK